MNNNLNKIDVLILCGGRGRRLGDIANELPKPMVKIKGYPFLDYIASYLKRSNFRRIILCTGYMSNKIKQYYSNKKIGLDIVFSDEKAPLETGGAVKNAENLIKSDPFVVMNGDSICKISFQDFLKFHFEKRAKVSIVVTALKKFRECFGNIKLDERNRIANFKEKIRVDNTNFVNVGIYLFNREILGAIPKNQKYSLEYQLFPHLKGCFGFVVRNDSFIDIGIPANFKKAMGALPELKLI